MILANVIGTGVFVKARVMTSNVGTPAMALPVWLVAGLLSMAGALIYAELSTMMPRSGGEYHFLGAAYGRRWAFLFGWMKTVAAAGCHGTPRATDGPVGGGGGLKFLSAAASPGCERAWAKAGVPAVTTSLTVRPAIWVLDQHRQPLAGVCCGDVRQPLQGRSDLPIGKQRSS